MSSFGKVISLNDEHVEAPKIRRDQQRKCQNLVRTNSQFPIVALGLLRDYLKGIDTVRTIKLDDEVAPTRIEVILKSDITRMSTTYTYRLEAPHLLETPTLD
jgi:hypothetical protein